jgi:Domain of Unknown Function (DUF928)
VKPLILAFALTSVVCAYAAGGNPRTNLLVASKTAQSQTPANQTADSSESVESSKKPPDKVSAKPPAHKARKIPHLYGFDEIPFEQRSSLVGVTRQKLPVKLLAPVMGRSYTLYPHFYWIAEKQGTNYEFVLRDSSSKEILRLNTASASDLIYPKTAPALMPGKTYYWSIESENGGVKSTSSTVGIQIIAGEERSSIEAGLAERNSKNDYKSSLDAAQLLTSFRLWYDVVEKYNDLIREFPDNENVLENRGIIYSQIQATQDLAAEDFSQVDHLQSAKRKQ